MSYDFVPPVQQVMRPSNGSSAEPLLSRSSGPQRHIVARLWLLAQGLSAFAGVMQVSTLAVQRFAFGHASARQTAVSVIALPSATETSKTVNGSDCNCTSSVDAFLDTFFEGKAGRWPSPLPTMIMNHLLLQPDTATTRHCYIPFKWQWIMPFLPDPAGLQHNWWVGYLSIMAMLCRFGVTRSFTELQKQCLDGKTIPDLCMGTMDYKSCTELQTAADSTGPIIEHIHGCFRRDVAVGVQVVNNAGRFVRNFPDNLILGEAAAIASQLSLLPAQDFPLRIQPKSKMEAMADVTFERYLNTHFRTVPTRFQLCAVGTTLCSKYLILHVFQAIMWAITFYIFLEQLSCAGYWCCLMVSLREVIYIALATAALYCRPASMLCSFEFMGIKEKILYVLSPEKFYIHMLCHGAIPADAARGNLLITLLTYVFDGAAVMALLLGHPPMPLALPLIMIALSGITTDLMGVGEEYGLEVRTQTGFPFCSGVLMMIFCTDLAVVWYHLTTLCPAIPPHHTPTVLDCCPPCWGTRPVQPHNKICTGCPYSPECGGWGCTGCCPFNFGGQAGCCLCPTCGCGDYCAFCDW